MPRAASKYKQVRLTLTEEAERGYPDSVLITLRMMVKPVNAEWSQRHTFLVERRPGMTPLTDINDVYACLLEMLSQTPLPGHIG